MHSFMQMFCVCLLVTSGTIATDAPACSILAGGNLIPTVYQLLKDQGGDDAEFTLQCLNCFDKYECSFMCVCGVNAIITNGCSICFDRLLHTAASRDVVMYNTRLFADIIDALAHKNLAVRRLAEKMSEFGT